MPPHERRTDVLLVSRIDIRNFVVFGKAAVHLSIDDQKPATIIRAENGSGKTTFLRAVRWGFYGEEGLPGADTRARERFGVQPIDWEASKGNVETSVRLDFWTDGATRQQEAEGVNRSHFRLSRSVRTVPHEPASEDDVPFRRVGHVVTLMRKNIAGDWVDFDRDPDEAVRLLLPGELRDFYFVDADEATDDYIGGGDRARAQHTIVDSTTKAVKELLGLSVVDLAAKRLKDQAAEFRRAASRASGDRDITELQRNYDEARDGLSSAEEELQQVRDDITDLEDDIEHYEQDLEEKLRATGDPDGLAKHIQTNKQALAAALERRRQLLRQLSSQLEAPELLGALALPTAQSVHDMLHDDHARGLIPMSHLAYVKERLDTGECMCGEPLTHGSPLRERVERNLKLSSEQEDRANLLGETFRAVDDLLRDARSSSFRWDEPNSKLEADLGEIDRQVGELRTESERLQAQLERIDAADISSLKKLRDGSKRTLQDDRIPKERDLQRQVKDLTESVETMRKELQSRTKQQSAAQEASSAEQLGLSLHEALMDSYRRIQSDQVDELSRTMNGLFQEMVADVRTDTDADVATGSDLRTFRAIGIEPTPKDDTKFRIFARDRHGRTLASTEINGASRRILAMSFILGLAKESQTEAPLFADSLLNMMSGIVRLNALRATCNNARQPVLLLTRADIGPNEADVIDRLAGQTYTFTSGSGQQSTVKNQDVASQDLTVVCECGPREFCPTCELTTDASDDDLTRRQEAS